MPIAVAPEKQEAGLETVAQIGRQALRLRVEGGLAAGDCMPAKARRLRRRLARARVEEIAECKVTPEEGSVTS